MKRNVVIVCMAAVIAVLFLSGCSKQEGKEAAASGRAKPIRFLTDWNTEREMFNPFHERFQAFVKANNMDVTLEVSLDPENRNKMQIEIAAGSPADVFKWWVTPSNCTYLYENEVAIPTREMIDASDYLTDEMFSAESRKTGTYKGVSYGLPIYGSSGFFVINKALYDKYNVPIPKTWEEFREGGKIFIRNGIIPAAVGSKLGNPSHYWMSAIWTQFPGALEELDAIASGGTLAPSSGNAKKTAQIVADDIALGMYTRDPVANGNDQCFAMLLDDRAAATYAMPYQMQQVTTEQAPKIEIIPIPLVEGGVLDTANTYYLSPTNGYHMSRIGFADEGKRAAMIKLVDYLCSRDILDLYAQTEEMVINLPFDFSTFSEAKKKMEEFKKGKNTYSSVQFTRVANATVWTQYKDRIDELFTKMITPDQFQSGIAEVWAQNR
jgi:raffinose/stachyose/melibiose transport system substrate-binding protein